MFKTICVNLRFDLRKSAYQRCALVSGGRVSNTLATYLGDGHSSPKGVVIPDSDAGAQAIRIYSPAHIFGEKDY